MSATSLDAGENVYVTELLHGLIWTAVCSSCGKIEAGDRRYRFAGMLAAHELRSAGWTPDGDGGVLCADCSFI